MAETATDVLVAGYQEIDEAMEDFESLVALVRDKRVLIEGVILVTHAQDGSPRRGGARDQRLTNPPEHSYADMTPFSLTATIHRLVVDINSRTAARRSTSTSNALRWRKESGHRRVLRAVTCRSTSIRVDS